MDNHGRRSLLKWITGGLVTLVGAAIAGPAAWLLAHPLRRRTVSGGEEPVVVARLDQLPDGVPVRATVIAPSRFDAWTRFDQVALGAVWLLRRGGEVTAYSSVCPHAGCFVDYEAMPNSFHCPCHGSVFTLDGACTAGPSPRSLDTLPAFVKDGSVLVAYRRYRQAQRAKEPV